MASSEANDIAYNNVEGVKNVTTIVSGIQRRPSVVDAASGYSKNDFFDTNPQTLTRYILTCDDIQPEERADLSIILNAICTACKIISHAASKAGIFDLYGLAGTGNASGDDQKKLDIYGNDCMINCLSSCGKVAYMASEENEGAIFVEGAENKYVVSFDPVDGSSNIDANVSVGTIFGIYATSDETRPNQEDLLQRGTELVCSGYCMYGGATIMVLTFGQKVNGFTLDPSVGEFIQTHPNIRIKQRGKIYSVNEGNAKKWDESVTEFVQSCKDRSMKARYIGSMVADVHRTLLYGGVFMYPGDKKSPSGKLRLVYELNPMAFLIETAGGIATTGLERIRDIKPEKIHERKPIFLGSPANVKEIMDIYKKNTAASEEN